MQNFSTSQIAQMGLKLKAKYGSLEDRGDRFSNMYRSAYDTEFERLYAKHYSSIIDELHAEASQRAESLVVKKWCAWFAGAASFPITVMQEIQGYLSRSDMFTVRNEAQLKRSHVQSIANVYSQTMRDMDYHKTVNELLSSYKNGTWVLLQFHCEPILGNQYPMNQEILERIKLDWEGDFRITRSSKVKKGINFIGTLRCCRNPNARVKIETFEANANQAM